MPHIPSPQRRRTSRKAVRPLPPGPQVKGIDKRIKERLTKNPELSKLLQELINLS